MQVIKEAATSSDGAASENDRSQAELMSVTEMGQMLGLKKTDRYWLVHKNLFESRIWKGKLWVVRNSFEAWYANQVKYHKVNGEEPGRKLKEKSYSARDIAEILMIDETTAYDIIKKNNLPTIMVDYWMRVPREAFEQWYAGQNHYRNHEDREKEQALKQGSLSMPEMASYLGITRQQVYGILRDRRFQSWFEYVVISGQKRVTWESFDRFLDSQEQYRLKIYPDDDGGGFAEKNVRLSNYRQRKLMQGASLKSLGNQEYLTVDEAALLAGVSRVTISDWMRRKCFPVQKAGGSVRIDRTAFEQWAARWAGGLEEE